MIARHLALAAALTAGSVLLLTACGPDGTAPPAAAAPTGKAAAPSPSAKPAGTPPVSSPSTGSTPTGGTPSAVGTPGTGSTPAPGAAPSASGAPAPGSAPSAGGAPAVPARGTGTPNLTISNGTDLVQMPDSVADFHTPVRDLSWSPDGAQAVFVNGNGDLVTSRPDGTGQVVAARNPGGQTWSHPTWVMAMPDAHAGLPHRDFIVFTADQGGTTRLLTVPGDQGTTTPTVLSLPGGPDDPGLPQTGNTWANQGGSHGSIVYANSTDGSIYIRDEYTRTQAFKLTSGSQPALSPDGNQVLFVRSTGGHDHLFEMQLNPPSTPQDLTPQATTDYTEPAWSPDGTELTARTPTGTMAMPSDGSLQPHEGGYAMPGLPAYR